MPGLPSFRIPPPCPPIVRPVVTPRFPVVVVVRPPGLLVVGPLCPPAIGPLWPLVVGPERPVDAPCAAPPEPGLAPEDDRAAGAGLEGALGLEELFCVEA